MTMNERIERLNAYINEGRVIRNQWTGTDAQGRETACLLAALSPEAGSSQEASACPAHVMPSWLAYLTTDLNDRGSNAAWPGMVRRYAALAARWHRLDDAAWLRVQYKVLAATVREAKSYVADQADVLAACEQVVELCEQVVETGKVDEEAFRAAAARAAAARAAADAVVRSAAWAAARAAWVAADAADAADAASAPSRAAAWAAETARVAEVAAWAAAAAWDHVTAALFEAIEVELDGAGERTVEL
jgi:hypothetical protein